MNKDLESVVEREVDAMGYDVVLLRQGGTKSRPVVELRIDRRDGERVSVADCVRVSRAVEARLDAASGEAAPFAGRRYELQVSSPGDAPRQRAAHASLQHLNESTSGSGEATHALPSLAAASGAEARKTGREQSDISTRESEVPHSGPADVHTDDGSRNGRFD
jgi:hypothetical protein